MPLDDRAIDELIRANMERLSDAGAGAAHVSAPVEPDRPERAPHLSPVVWDGLIQEYREIVEPCTEAPVEFHLGAFFVATAVLVGRRVWLESPHRTFANLFVLLLGKTAEARKTTAYLFAIRLGEEVRERLGLKLKPLWGLASVEGLASAMRDGETGTFNILAIEDEFRSLISKAGQRATANLVPRLTELYNCLPRFEVNTKADRIEIHDPFLSVISSSTESWFGGSLVESDVSGGFVNRWCVFAGRSDRLIPVPPKPDPERWSALVASVAERVTRAEGNYAISNEALRLYSEFYAAFRRRKGDDSALEATGRADVHALKFGLLYAVLAGHSQIEREDLDRGIALATYCADAVVASISCAARTPMGIREEKTLAALRMGPMTTREIARRFHWSFDELNRVILGLSRAGMIAIRDESTIAGHQRKVVEAIE